MMKRTKMIMAVLCACLVAAGAVPLTEAAEEETEEEAQTAADRKSEAEVPRERPDYTALDYVELGNYKNLKVTLDAPQVTDEEVLAEADAQIRDLNILEPVDTVQEGDEVNIDFTGTVDGEEFDGNSSEGYTLEIGSGTFIEGFEEGLIGAHTGDSVELDLTFPEEYYFENLAGQDVVYIVTVNEILRVPELSDDLVSEVTEGAYTDVQSWLDSLRSSLEADEESEYDFEVQEALLKELAACSEITGYPDGLLEYTVAQSKGFYEELAERYYMTYEEFIGAFDYTEATFDEALEEAIKVGLDEELLLVAVAEAEDMTLSDEEYQAGLSKYASYYGFDSTDEFEEAYEEAYGDKMLRVSLLMDKVFDFLQENAQIEVIEPETETETETEIEA